MLAVKSAATVESVVASLSLIRETEGHSGYYKDITR